MAIKDRDLKAGTNLVATYKQENYQAKVTGGDNGKVVFQFPDDRVFKSLSAAGKAITGAACNGWAFWTLEADNTNTNQEEPPTATKPEVRIDQEPDPQRIASTPETDVGSQVGEDEEITEPVSALFRRVANQQGLATGEERLFCDACGKGFAAILGEQPNQCPEGHTPQAHGNWAAK